jgi:hypothetical protein
MRANDLVKNRWQLLVSDPEKHKWSDNLINLVNNAYSATSLGSFVQNASQVAASDWVALDWDPQPDLDCTVFYRKARPNESWTGYKIQGIGHDGKTESKQKVIARVKALLTKPGTWIESSDAMARTLGKLGLQPVTDESTLHALFPESNLTLQQDGSYIRQLQNGEKIRETVYGNPSVRSLNEDSNWEQDTRYTSEELRKITLATQAIEGYARENKIEFKFSKHFFDQMILKRGFSKITHQMIMDTSAKILKRGLSFFQDKEDGTTFAFYDKQNHLTFGVRKQAMNRYLVATVVRDSKWLGRSEKITL